MSMSKGVAVAITGAGNADLGLNVLTAVNVSVSAAATVQIREGAANGAIVIAQVFAAAGQFSPQLPAEGLRCATSGTGTFFIVNSAGDLGGGVAGLDLAT